MRLCELSSFTFAHNVPTCLCVCVCGLCYVPVCLGIFTVVTVLQAHYWWCVRRAAERRRPCGACREPSRARASARRTRWWRSTGLRGRWRLCRASTPLSCPPRCLLRKVCDRTVSVHDFRFILKIVTKKVKVNFIFMVDSIVQAMFAKLAS